MAKTCTGTFDGNNHGLPCDYVFCPEEEVLYCNFCLQDEPPPQVDELATTPPKTKSDSSASASASASTST